MSDLEDRLRDALHAKEIESNDLRRPTLRANARGTRRWPAMLAAAAAVVVVAGVAVGIAATRGSSTSAAATGGTISPTTSATVPAYAGFAWRLTSLSDAKGAAPYNPSAVCPRSSLCQLPATVQVSYTNSTAVATIAGVSLSAHYTPTAHGYTVSGGGFAGLPGDAAPSRLLSDVASLFVLDADIGPGKVALRADSGTPFDVTAQPSGDQLVLTAKGVTMHLTRIGQERLSPVVDALGYQWRAVSLTDPQGELTIPADDQSVLDFGLAADVTAKDPAPMVAFLSLTDTGYRIGGASFGDIGGTHPSAAAPAQRRVYAAIATMTADKAEVTAAINGDVLTLQRNGITLTLDRGAADSPSQLQLKLGSARSVPNSPPAQPGSPAPFVGYRWKLVTVLDANGRTSIPDTIDATVLFTTTGDLLGDDGINSYDRRYALTPDGYRPTGDPTAGGAGSVAGPDTPQGKATQAIQAAFDIVRGRDIAAASVSGDTLTIKIGGNTLETLKFTRDGTQSGSPTH